MVQEFLAAVVLGCVILVLAILLLTVFAHMRTATPYGGTPAAVRKAMVKLAGLRRGHNVCDIGAGDGRILIAAKDACCDITAVGFENAPGVWLFGKVRIWLSGKDIRFFLCDGRRANLARADAVFLYVGPEMMRNLKPKFDRELKEGARVISHTFRFPGKKPARMAEVPVGRRKKKIYLYEW